MTLTLMNINIQMQCIILGMWICSVQMPWEVTLDNYTVCLCIPICFCGLLHVFMYVCCCLYCYSTSSPLGTYVDLLGCLLVMLWLHVQMSLKPPAIVTTASLTLMSANPLAITQCQNHQTRLLLCSESIGMKKSLCWFSSYCNLGLIDQRART